MQVILIKDAGFLLKGAVLTDVVEIYRDIWGDPCERYWGHYSCKEGTVQALVTIPKDCCEILEE